MTSQFLLLCFLLASSVSAVFIDQSIGLNRKSETVYEIRGNFRIPDGQRPSWRLEGIKGNRRYVSRHDRTGKSVKFLINQFKERQRKAPIDDSGNDLEEDVTYVDNIEFQWEKVTTEDLKYMTPVYLIFPPVKDNDNKFTIKYWDERCYVQRISEDDFPVPLDDPNEMYPEHYSSAREEYLGRRRDPHYSPVDNADRRRERYSPIQQGRAERYVEYPGLPGEGARGQDHAETSSRIDKGKRKVYE